MFDGKHGAAEAEWTRAVLHEFDFSVVGNHCHLVCSAPGIHWSQALRADTVAATGVAGESSHGDPEMYGLRRLHYLLRTKMRPGFFTATPRATMKNTGGGSRAAGTAVTGDAVEAACSSVSNYTYGLHPNVMQACQGHDELDWSRLRLFYPSTRRACQLTRTDPLGCDQASFAAKSPLRGCEPGCTRQHRCRPCLLHELTACPAQHPARSRVVQHTKMLLRESTKEGATKGRGWIYAGSHNLSTSAWGSANLTKDTKAEQASGQKRNRVNHYELGVLLTDVRISDYARVVPWDRSGDVERWRYRLGRGDVPFPH